MSEIANFYKNRSVFITGATGFVGKATVEKLLRSCPEIARVYILIRPNKKVSDIKARVDELLNNSIFAKLKKENPEAIKKIIPIAGDVSEPQLGISETDQDLLINDVSVVIHSAATVRFNEPLKMAVKINVCGTESILKLCNRMSKLVSLVHISTAYVNCERKESPEYIHLISDDPYEIIKKVDAMDPEMAEKMTPEIIGKKPNTYAYTKSLAENLILAENNNFPLCIVRPSIVTSSLKEPTPGWIDNYNGPTGMGIAVGKGVLRTAFCYGELKADWIPVDTTANCIIAAGWRTATSKCGDIQVYNCCSGDLNPIHWGTISEQWNRLLQKDPLDDVVWYPEVKVHASRMWFNITYFLLHFLPGIIYDTFANITNRKPKMLRIYNKINDVMNTLEVFIINEFHFPTINTQELFQCMSPIDKYLFNFDVREIDWTDYIENYCRGIRQHIFKQTDEKLCIAKKHVLKLYYIHQLTRVFSVVFCIFTINTFLNGLTSIINVH